jgi:hypothetical protein
MGYDNQHSCAIQSHSNPSILIFTLMLVNLGQRLWVKKDGSRALEGHSMFSKILPRLDWIPLELVLERFRHVGMIPRMKLAAKKATLLPACSFRISEARPA